MDVEAKGEPEDNHNANNNADNPNPPNNRPKAFRQTGKKFFLTYPKAYAGNGHPNGLAGFVKDILDTFKPLHYLICEENHQDGTKHYHALLEFAAKLNIKSPTHWDIGGNHGNYQTVRNKSAVIQYIKKAGNYQDNMEEFCIDAVNPGSKRKVFHDLEWAKMYRLRAQRRDVPWPLKIRDANGFDHVMNAPDITTKRRSWWIVSRPDTGKSFWVERVLGNCKLLLISGDSKYPYEDYAGEQLIINDDRYPKFAECADALNQYSNFKCVYGDTRYIKVYWDMGKARNMIVLVNKTIDETYAGNDQIIAAMHARFVQIVDPLFTV